MREDLTNPICGPPLAWIRISAPRRTALRSTTPLGTPLLLVTIAVLCCFAPAISAAWVEFVDETATRLVAAPANGVEDQEEKSFSWGDLDHDGDIDLVVGRKQPWTTPGKRTNVLFVNQDGVLTDRTADFATASDVAGDQGFLTPTNDRDIRMVDVDLDGWLDVVTVATLSDSDPKHIGHPRIYINLGCSEGGTEASTCTTDDWLGLRYEEPRIPAMLTYTGESGFNPRFLAVSAGDVNGDGYTDLWFSDNDLAGQPPGADFNDKLLLNQGASNPGFFTDVTADMFGVVPGPGGAPFPVSSLGSSSAIADMNDDGTNDIVKMTALNPPQYTAIAYNGEGGFESYDVVYTNAGYYVSVADLNNDDLMDMVITDEGPDRYLLNQGPGGDGQASFLSFVFSFSHDGQGTGPSDEGFSGDNVIADLDGDGWNDVLITDISLDLGGCSRRLHLYHNLGGQPGDSVSLQEETTGSGCEWFQGNPSSCIVAGIPASELTGVHDVAVFDIDGDNRKDLVLGRCSGVSVLMSQPVTPAGGVPDGDAVPGSPLTVDLDPTGRVILSWNPSCQAADSDYGIYEGMLGDFASHTARLCSTGGATTATFSASSAAYFLVVPSNGDREGSYGNDSSGAPRSPAVDACLAQEVAACE